ncbi:MAG: ABC transporter permease [Bacillota bacterium]
MFKIVKREAHKRSFLYLLGIPLLAIAAALAVASLLILAIGIDPIKAYGAMFTGAFGSTYRSSEVLVKMTPLLLTGLGVAFAFRTGMFNMGAEGQLAIGTIACIVVMLYVPAGAFVIPLALLAAFVAGGLYGAIPGILKAKLSVSEAIVTIMMNFIATLLVSRLLNSVLKDPNGYLPQTALTPKNAYMSVLIENTRLHTGFIIAIALAIIGYLVMFYMPVGFKMRAVGSNRNAARYGGYKISAMMVLSMVISGGLAGLAGAIEIGGLHHRLLEGISANYGWDAIAVALIGKQNPLGILISSLLFAALKVGGNAMQSSQGVPYNLVDVLQGLVILFTLGSDFFGRYKILYVRQAKEKQINV